MKLNKEYYENNENYSEFKISVKGIRIFKSIEEPMCVYFIGRKQSGYHQSFSNEMDLTLWIDQRIKKVYDIAKEKSDIRDLKKIQASEKFNKIKIGDIFHTSWGYNMTINDFFQVISKPSEKKVEIRQIEKEWKTGNCQNDDVRGIKDAFCDLSKNVLVNSGGSLVGADEYKHNAYPCDGDRWYYENHMD